MRDDFVAVVVCVFVVWNETKKKNFGQTRCLTETKKKHTKQEESKKKKVVCFFCENTQKTDEKMCYLCTYLLLSAYL